MAEQFDNTNRGGLWINKRKEKDNHPDYTGSVNVGGVEFWLSAWKRFSPKSGEAYLSISVKEKDEKPSVVSTPTNVDDFLGGPKPTTGIPEVDTKDDDIPF